MSILQGNIGKIGVSRNFVTTGGIVKAFVPGRTDIHRGKSGVVLRAVRVAGTSSANARWALRAEMDGTVATTVGSAIVTGTGTKFLSQLAIGDYIYIEDNDEKLVVLTVDSDTQVTAAITSSATQSGSLVFKTLEELDGKNNRVELGGIPSGFPGKGMSFGASNTTLTASSVLYAGQSF